MTSKKGPIEGQRTLPVDYVVPLNEYIEGVVPVDSRLKLKKLIEINGEGLPIESNEPPDTLKDFAGVASIEQGLYIARDDPRYRDAESIITTHPEALRFEEHARTGLWGIVFPSDEFKVVARSPHDLAKTVRNNTRDAGRDTPTVQRSAAHALDQKVSSLERLEGVVVSERELVRSLLQDFMSSAPHFKSRNLEKARHSNETQIHRAVDVASINLNLGNITLGAVHDEVRRRLHKQNQANREISWSKYLHMVGRYSTNRIDRIKRSKQRTHKELRKYKGALERSV